VSCTSHDPFNKSLEYILVSFWGSNRVDIFTSSLIKISSTPSLPALPRSLLLYNFYPPSQSAKVILLVGLSNGTLSSFTFNDNTLSDQKVMNLGEAPISSLTTCELNGKKGIVACGSRAGVLYVVRERFCHSPILLTVRLLPFIGEDKS
jgi:DNA damage-binding protein 1